MHIARAQWGFIGQGACVHTCLSNVLLICTYPVLCVEVNYGLQPDGMVVPGGLPCHRVCVTSFVQPQSLYQRGNAAAGDKME